MTYDWQNDPAFERLDLEDKIAKIVGDESVAHLIMTLLHETDPDVLACALHDFRPGKEFAAPAANVRKPPFLLD